MKITSRGGFSVGRRARRLADRREGVVIGIRDVKAVKGAADFVLTVKIDGNKSSTVSNAAFFEPAELDR